MSGKLRGQDLEHPVTITLVEAYHGTQRVLTKDDRRLEVRIPPGVRTGSKVRLAGEGVAGVVEAGGAVVRLRAMSGGDAEATGAKTGAAVVVP